MRFGSRVPINGNVQKSCLCESVHRRQPMCPLG
jgi:hypothetical protein